MKRIIKANSDFNSLLTEHSTYNRGSQKFSIYENKPNPVTEYKAQISEIHPYDDAEYTWARVGYKGVMSVEFIKNGKVVDRMQLHYYEPDDYESEDEYFDDIIDMICVELRGFNKDVEPRIARD